MQTTKVFKNGNSQAVRLPKAFQFDVNEVEILRRDDEVILRKKKKNLREAFTLLTDMPEDFFKSGRVDLTPEERESF
jgi:antitoxin VapB